uniref:Glycosyltransferase n=1 Tax=Mantoniella antarctica TaxID=81844 RepID=A0A7S0SWE8_9CHLO|mmetsp:Transcript_35696/g.89165  ORF Transcript_35696/g.89165 Transcript_35696/m.89165 type:complete len:314 (+) Transcript_35696:128-1069(+)
MRRTSGLARLGLYVIAGILSSLAIALPFHSSWGSSRRSAAVAGRTTTAAAPPFAGLLSFCHGPKFEAMESWTSRNHREYARRHRYDVFQGDDNILPHMHFLEPFAWLKAGLLWQLLQARSAHQWFVWVDCDALYMNLDKSVPDLLRDLGVDPGPAGTTHVVAADDLGSSLFNTGVLVVRNSQWSRDFFANVLRSAKHHDVRNHGWWEQFAMQELYKQNHHEEQKRVAIIQERYKLNAFTNQREYVDGVSFVLHQVFCPGDQPNTAATVAECGRKFKGYFCTTLAEMYPKQCSEDVSVQQEIIDARVSKLGFRG